MLEESNKYHVLTCDNAEDVINSVKLGQVDLLITSFVIPEMGAIELISRLASYSKHTKVIVCSSESSLLIVEKCIQSGAHGYITANVSREELLDAVSIVLAGKVYTERAVSQELALTKIRGEDYLLESLSPREFDIFMKIIRDKPVKLVAKELFLAEKTVANYVCKIKKKLDTNTNVGLLDIAIREGFMDYAAYEGQN